MLRWPIPILLIINVGGEFDLDLNSARNEIVYTDKWNKFEQKLSEIICAKIKENVNAEYWNKLFPILDKTKSENFKLGLNNIK